MIVLYAGDPLTKCFWRHPENPEEEEEENEEGIEEDEEGIEEEEEGIEEEEEKEEEQGNKEVRCQDGFECFQNSLRKDMSQWFGTHPDTNGTCERGL